MRCAVRREDERLRLLVEALDVGGAPMAETWRRVGATEAANGRLRPSYPLVRRLVLAHRAREEARRRMREAAVEAAVDFLAGRVPDVHHTIDRLRDAHLAEVGGEPCVSETQGSFAPPSRVGGGRRTPRSRGP